MMIPKLWAARISLLTFFAASILPANAAAAAPTAMLYASGSVKVNGALVKGSSALFSGDRVSVQGNSAGTLSADGSSISLAAGSSATLLSGRIRVDNGSAAIQTSKNLSVTSGDITAMPETATSRFTVNRSQRSITVASLEGSVRVQQGTRALLIPQGKMATFVCNTCDDSAGPSPAPPQGGTAGTGESVTWPTVVGITATIVTGVAAAIIVGQQKSSPSGP